MSACHRPDRHAGANLIGILPGICVGLLSGCSAFQSAKYSDRVGEIDVMIQQLSSALEAESDREKKAKISSQIDLLRTERESLQTKIKVAQKAREGAGSGIESILAIAGLLLGVPLLGSAGSVAKSIISGKQG